MPNLNAESKLITPGQALFFAILAACWAVWYYDLNVIEQLENLRDAIHHVTGGIL